MFRVAAEASARRNATKTAAQIVVFWGLFLGVIPAAIRWIEDAAGISTIELAGQRAIGVALFAGASALGLWSAAAIAVWGKGTPLPLDAPRTLVLRGPYRVVRNPMAVAGITQGIAVGIGLGSLLVVLYALAGAIVWHVAVRPVEEADLLARFGAPYAEYRERVRCWWPRPR